MTQTIPSAAERIVLRLSKEFDEAPDTIARLVIAIEEGISAPMLAWHPRETRAVRGDGRMAPERIYEIARRLEEIKILEEHRSVALSKLEAASCLDEAVQERAKRCHSLESLDELLAEFGLASAAHFDPGLQQRVRAAEEKGVLPLAAMLRDRNLPEGKAPLDAAEAFVSEEKGLPDAKSALDAARACLLHEVTNDRALLRELRDQPLQCRPASDKKLPKDLQPFAKLEKRAKSIPAREFLAIKRGMRTGHLEMRLALSEEKAHQVLATRFVADLHDPSDPLRSFWDSLLREAWVDVLRPRIEHEIFEKLRERSEQTALQVLAERYEQILRQPGIGPRRVLGVLPSLRKPARLAALDEQGRVLHRASLDLSKPETQEAAKNELKEILEKFEIQFVALGNGLGFRDAETWLMQAFAELPHRPQLLVIDEAGSAEIAKKKRSKQELAARRAAIVARRAQNPMLEWARVEPANAPLDPAAAEVHQGHLSRRLGDVRSLVLHGAGVDLHDAGEDVLGCIEGIEHGPAHEMQKLRNDKEPPKSLGGFVERGALDADAMDRASVFLRFTGSEEPLDQLRIPVSLYGLVDECAALLGLTRAQLLEQPGALSRIEAAKLANEERSEVTIAATIEQLQRKPGVGLRQLADAPFRSDLRSIDQVEIGMELTGRVLRLLEFGAFVDLGLPVGGLLHVSQLANHFVDDPAQIVHAGEVVTVRVLEVDKGKGRISLTMREGDIEKIPRTLGDFASGKRKPGARVVDPGERREREERGPSSRFDQRSGRSEDRGGRRGGGGRRDRGDRGDRGGRGGDRGGRGARPGGGRRDDRDVPFRRGQGGYVVESDDLREEMAKDRGAKGELKSFAALAGLFGSEPADAADKSGPAEKKDEAPKAQESKQPSPEPSEPSPAKEAIESESPPSPSSPPSSDAPAEKPEDESTPEADEERKGFGEDFV